MPESALAVTFYCADQNPHRDRSLGITSYTQGLMSHLAGRDDLSVSAITSRSSFPLPAGMREQRLAFRTDSMGGRLAADHLHRVLTSTRAAIWHYPKGFLPVFLPRKVPLVCTLHDTILQHYADHYPETRSRFDFAYWLWITKRSLARADLVLTVSETARADILALCERYRITPPPVRVTYQGINVSGMARGDATACTRKGDYVLHLASTLPHKRTRWLCETWQALQQSGVQLPALLLVGSLDAETAAIRSAMEGVQLQGRVSRADLTQYLSAAQALLLPSEIEGFGLPAVEAYYAGTPVAYVKGTAVEEVLGPNTPGGFQLNIKSFSDALADVLALSASAVEQKAAELRARFSWEKVSDRTVAGYRSVL